MKKAHQRQLDIIQILYHDASWHHFNDIAKAVDASVYSIREDITTIATTFNDYIKISENKQTVRAEFRQDANLETFRRYFLKETVPLQFIEALFFNPFLELEDLADQILTSRSTVYRFIPDLNDTLQENFGLELTTKPLKIVGEERQIRNFFTLFFNTRYHPLSWPFDDLDESAIHKVIQLICDVLQLSVAPAQLHQLKFMVAISIVRYQKRQYLSPQYLTKEVSTTISRIHPYLDESPYASYFSSIIHQNIDQGTLYDIFYPVLITAVDADAVDSSQDHQSLTESFLSLSTSLNIDISNIDRFIHGLLNVFNNETVALVYQSTKAIRANTFVEKIEQTYPELYKGLTQIFYQFAVKKNTNISEATLNQLVFYSVTHWPNLINQLHVEKTPIKVVVISDLSYEHARLIAENLKGYFEDALTIDTIENGSYDSVISEDSPYEIIVTSFDLTPITGKYIVNADPFPDADTYTYIQQIMNTIYEA
ncbi:helix-turn-helix domain-containing protein [Aerococcaceae bacterium DSM 111022]|nr:helix-turn-helix domain-containing protein [Aerococcaceae bacterium DSM 111022]